MPLAGRNIIRFCPYLAHLFEFSECSYSDMMKILTIEMPSREEYIMSGVTDNESPSDQSEFNSTISNYERCLEENIQ